MEHGAGVHQWDLRLSELESFYKVSSLTIILSWAKSIQVAYVAETYYNPLIFVTKLSILIQYYKIFVAFHGSKTYWMIQILIWLNALFYFAITLVFIMPCFPIKRFWDPTVPGRCIDLPMVLMASAFINIFSDISILILPIFKVWQLQLTRKRKLGFSAVFGTGLL